MSGLSRSPRQASKPATGPIGQLVEQFLDHVRAGGRTHWTLEAYTRHLRGMFVPFAEERNAWRVEDLTSELVQAFATELNRTSNVFTGQALSKASVKTYLKSVQQFLSWLKAEREAEVEPAKVPLPQLRKVHREVLSRQEIAHLEQAARSERDRLVVRIMADTGAREGEVAELRIDDLIVKDRSYFIRLRGKTGERMPPVSRGLHYRLRQYAQQGRPQAARSNRLFLADRRVGGIWQPLGRSGVYRLVKDALIRMEFPRRAYPHLLRHSAISWMVEQGMPVPMVSEITGVSVQVIMSNYWHTSDENRYLALERILIREQVQEDEERDRRPKPWGVVK